MCVFRLRVLSAKTGAPIPRARVRVVRGGVASEHSTAIDGVLFLPGTVGEEPLVDAVEQGGFLPFGSAWADADSSTPQTLSCDGLSIISLEPSVSCMGRVSDSDGHPAVSATVEAWSANGGVSCAAVAPRADGTFETRCLEDGRMRAVSPQGASEEVDCALGPAALRVTQRGGLSIHGRVVDQAGRNYSGVAVRFDAVDGAASTYAITSSAGVFEASWLRAGRYWVLPLFGNLAAGSPVLVRAGQRDVLLRAAAPGAIEVEVVDQHDAPLQPLQAWLLDSSREGDVLVGAGRRVSLQGGARGRIRHVPPGDYAISVSGLEFAKAWSRVVVEPGSVARVKLVATRARVIRGVIKDQRTGLGIPGARLTVLGDGLGLPAPLPALCDELGRFSFHAASNAPGATVEAAGYRTLTSFGLRDPDLVIELTPTDGAQELLAERVGLGLELERADDAVVATSVETSGPASRAGVQVDDVVEAINGVAASQALDDGFQDGPVGSVTRLLVQRGADVREVVLVSERFVFKPTP